MSDLTMDQVLNQPERAMRDVKAALERLDPLSLLRDGSVMGPELRGPRRMTNERIELHAHAGKRMRCRVVYRTWRANGQLWGRWDHD